MDDLHADNRMIYAAEIGKYSAIGALRKAGSSRRPLTVRDGCGPGLMAAVRQIAMAATMTPQRWQRARCCRESGCIRIRV
jgi:hypothetical protein